MTEQADWQRLADAIKTRRRELRLTQEQVAEAGGPSTATIRLLESGHPGGYRGRTFADLERVLDWMPGSVESVLAGHGPLAKGQLSAAGGQLSHYGVGEIQHDDEDDSGVVLYLPAGSLEGLTQEQRQEVAAVAAAAAFERARKIRGNE